VTIVALSLRGALFNLRDEIFESICFFEIQIHLPLADSEKVAMRISEAGHDRLAV